MTEIKFYKSQWKAIKLIMLCSIFTGLGFWGVLTGNMPTWVAWLNIIFFGLGYPVGLFHLFDRRPQIIINETGIFARTINNAFLNWEIIQDAYIIDIHKQKFICLVIAEQYNPSKNKNKTYKKADKFNEALGEQKFNISLGQVKIDYEKLTAFILQMMTASKPDKKELINKKLIEWKL